MILPLALYDVVRKVQDYVLLVNREILPNIEELDSKTTISKGSRKSSILCDYKKKKNRKVIFCKVGSERALCILKK
ncbi:MAG TPA: hypothetical protein VFJ51_01570, partial [Nitrososphaeraceae archaeon]|nr:hypothetical protein [Nitrososphaeraceae archaeon]